VGGTAASDRAVDRPRLFEHDLDPALFTGERLDDLVRRAPHVDVQLADPGRERPGLDRPVFTERQLPVLEDARTRQVQYRIYNPHLWAGSEYAECAERIFALAGPDPALGRVNVTTVIRVFSPGAVVALHTDVDVKLVSTLSGETVWWVRPPDETTPLEHENLLHGAFFLRWRESPDDRPLRIPAGHGCFVPCRWAHWLEHPGEEPVVSFEIGFWTYDAIRQRKVYDVNWALRKLRLDPRPAGGPTDGLKCELFDLASRLTGRVPQYRGRHLAR
jgi:hypothetical protein